MKIKSVLLAGLLGLASLLGSSAQAVTFGFERITNNASTDISSQLSLDVTQVGDNALFTIHNWGPVASSIANVYFDFGSTGFFSASNLYVNNSSEGVNFRNGGTPSNLPSGSTVGFYADDAGKAVNPAPTNGVNPDEWVSFIGIFQSGTNFNSLIDALLSDKFNVGLHVISIAGGTSDSFVSVSPVPLPAALPLMLSGLGALGFASRRRKQQAQA